MIHSPVLWDGLLEHPRSIASVPSSSIGTQQNCGNAVSGSSCKNSPAASSVFCSTVQMRS